MDRGTLLAWKSELENSLAQLEKNMSKLEYELRGVKEKLRAINTLLAETNGDKSERQDITSRAEVAVIADFLSILRRKGWSIDGKTGQQQIYTAQRGGQTQNLWVKYSSFHEKNDFYWFGIDPKSLEELSAQAGGVVLLLLDQEFRYLSFAFAKFRELLEGATHAKTGQKFHVKEKGSRILLNPAGTGKWIDVSAFEGEQGLRRLGLAD